MIIVLLQLINNYV